MKTLRGIAPPGYVMQTPSEFQVCGWFSDERYLEQICEQLTFACMSGFTKSSISNLYLFFWMRKVTFAICGRYQFGKNDWILESKGQDVCVYSINFNGFILLLFSNRKELIQPNFDLKLWDWMEARMQCKTSERRRFGWVFLFFYLLQMLNRIYSSLHFFWTKK